MPVTAIVPLKSLAAAKGRLAEALAPDDRRAVVAWMARTVLEACRSCAAVDEVIVIAGDEAGARLARDAGVRAEVVTQAGLTAAMAAADSLTADRRATVVVAADLPGATADDVAAVVAAAGDGTDPVVAIAPTRDGGTGALFRRPPTVIVPAYGTESAAVHERRAREAGARAVVVDRPGLALDVDTPDQLREALAPRRRLDVGSPPP